MKHYIEIQRLRTQDVVVDDTLTLEKNTDAFIQGDIISITEKIIKQQHHIPVKTDMLIILLTHIDILSDSISSRGTSIPIKPRKAYIPPVTVEAIFAI